MRRLPPSIRLPFPIVHEDESILVINKPPGLLTSSGPRDRRTTALELVRRYVAGTQPGARVGLIHRLDRDAGGLLIFSKDNRAYVTLKRQFFEHTVDRVYLALVHGTPNPQAGTIDSRLIERKDGSVFVTKNPRQGERAISHYETLERTKTQSLLRVRLETGKKHQIRVQLASRGVPIVNDPVYCDHKPNGPLRLVAVELGIDHPRTGQRMSFKIEPPAPMRVQRPC